MKSHGSGLKRAVLPLLFVTTSSLGFVSQGSAGELMAVLGDSMSSATMAGTYLAGPGGPGGDPLRNSYTLSWAAGGRIDSHYLKLKEALAREGRTLFVENYSEPGAKAADLAKQVTALNTDVNDRKAKWKRLTYATVLIGNNDACSNASSVGTNLAQFKESLRRALENFGYIRQSNRIKVLVGGIPMIPELGKDEIMESRTFLGLRCREVKRTLKMCPGLANWKNAEEFEKEKRRIVLRNEAIEQTVRLVATRIPNVDYHYSGVMESIELKPALLAQDCFHPNSNAQAMMSRLLWDDLPWFK